MCSIIIAQEVLFSGRRKIQMRWLVKGAIDFASAMQGKMLTFNKIIKLLKDYLLLGSLKQDYLLIKVRSVTRER